MQDRDHRPTQQRERRGGGKKRGEGGGERGEEGGEREGERGREERREETDFRGLGSGFLPFCSVLFYIIQRRSTMPLLCHNDAIPTLLYCVCHMLCSAISINLY
jgi:hypothetical protein